MKFDNQLNTFQRMLDEFSADKPLAKFLPGFFKKNKQMGSTDRRVASSLVYNYFRLGRACANLAVANRLFIAEFLCNHINQPFLNHFRPDLNSLIEKSIEEKIVILTQEGFNIEEVFPFHSHLSNGINAEAFLRSIFIQPDLFIRINAGKQMLIKAKLDSENIKYREINELTLCLPNGTKLDKLFPDNHWFEIQDLSSQQTGNCFLPAKYDSWWDACAASGGKSLLLHQLQPDIKLLVSDIRESVLNNLDNRFLQIGLRKCQKKTLDLLQNNDLILHHYEFDGIILDAPCSGSGTWGRTPEMISQFNVERIQFFSNLQKSIGENVVKYLKPGKPLIYITCSAFKEENEEVVNWMVKNLHLKVETQQLIKGYEHKADTMFVARLLKQ